MTINELREKLGVPPNESAARYLAPVSEEIDTIFCVECDDPLGFDESTCDLHCEGCCDCDWEDE